MFYSVHLDQIRSSRKQGFLLNRVGKAFLRASIRVVTLSQAQGLAAYLLCLWHMSGRPCNMVGTLGTQGWSGDLTFSQIPFGFLPVKRLHLRKVSSGRDKVVGAK